MANIPFRVPVETKGMEEFMKEMKKMDVLAADAIRRAHERRAKEVNARRKEPAPLVVGAKVWYQPERQPGVDKLEPRWKGPAKVLAREGQHSYVVELRPGVQHKAHRGQLKPHVEDEYNGEPFPLYYFSGRAPELEAAADEWNTKAVLKHRIGAGGKLEFLVVWQEGDKPTWQPWNDFVAGINTDVLQYVGTTTCCRTW